MTPLPVPASFADLSASWLAEALGDPTITHIDVTPLGPASGFLGDVARVRLGRGTDAHRNDDTGASGAATLMVETVVVKLPPADPGGRRVGTMLNAWAREQAFYLQIAPASPGAQVPRCHYAAGDPAAEPGRWVLVLEDCPSETLNAANGATFGQSRAAVEALAVFHARWWQPGPSRGGDRFDWMPGFDRAGVGGLQGAWLGNIPRFLERYSHLIPDGTDAWLRAFADELPRWSDRAATEPLTIVHADYRLDNLRYHEGRMVIIDWQTALRGPGPMDLSSFLMTSCSIPDRRKWEAELLDRYAEGLGTAGIAVDPEWMHRSYDENVLWWMGQYANNLAHLAPDDPQAQAALDTMVERIYTAAADREVARLLHH